MSRLRRIGSTSAALLGAGVLLIQLVPYRVQHPPVTAEPDWDTAQTEALARRACYDCHSNEGRVPWYGHVAPVAWLVRRHVDEARASLNFSDMDHGSDEADEAGDEVHDRKMPPKYYLDLHPEARLSRAERRALEAGLDATLRGSARHRRQTDDDHDSDDDSDSDD